MRISTALLATGFTAASLFGGAGAALASPGAQSAAQASACGPKVKFKNPAVHAVHHVCGKGSSIEGTVTDPKVDGKCAYIQGTLKNGRTLQSDRACGKGKTVPVNLKAPAGEKFKSFALQTAQGDDG